MSGTFEGTSALVTGGGSGIGQAAALALAAGGCTVTVAGHIQELLDDTATKVEAAGGSGQTALCDVTDEDAVRSAVRVATQPTGRLDFAVNSAGIDGGNVALGTIDYPNETFDDMIAVNVRGMFLSMKHELAQMVEQGAGSIVNIASGAGLLGVPGYAGYSASKHAEIGLTKTAALDYAARGVRINAICPALVNTPLIAQMAAENPDMRAALVGAHPIGRIAEPEEIADAIVWLCSNKSSFVTGIALPVDGGYSAQ